MGILNEYSKRYKKARDLLDKIIKFMRNTETVRINLEDILDVRKEHTQFLKDEKKYFEENFEEFYQKYPEQYIAIRNHKVIDSSEVEKTLIDRIYETGKKRLPTYIVKVTKERIPPIPMRTPSFK